MGTEFYHRVRPRESLVPVVIAFLLGLVIHAVDQALFVRAGPFPILLTAPIVATLTYLRVRNATRRRVFALLAWGFVGSGAAVLGVYLAVVGYELPRALTGLEMVLYDLGMFLWFVLTLAAAYALSAHRRGRSAVVALLLGPVVQAAFALLMVLLVESGLYA